MEWLPTRNVRTRTRLILEWMWRDPEDRLFGAACMFAKIVGEGKLRRSVAERLLLQTFPRDEEHRGTVADAFRTVGVEDTEGSHRSDVRDGSATMGSLSTVERTMR
jgi:hypothetical protein